MANIRITSVEDPLRVPSLVYQAVRTIIRAEAMGLLGEDDVIDRLDSDTLGRVLARISAAGIGRSVQWVVAESSRANASRLERVLQDVNEALDESPTPRHEWPRMLQVLGLEMLSKLLRVSPSSIRRYRDESRATPDDVAGRLHFLALVSGDLAGAYNDVGIRRWFERPRTALGNRTPAQILGGVWKPDADGPRRVRELAAALVAAGAS
jgi:hypothetical protein